MSHSTALVHSLGQAASDFDRFDMDVNKDLD